MYFHNSINTTFIIEPLEISGGTPVVSACTSVFTNELSSCSGDTVIQLTDGAAIFNTDILPDNDDSLSIGYPYRRFREVNSISGNSSVWVSTNRIETPELHLGLNSFGEDRILTANNVIIQNDILNGGIF
jgi:hypothetical protein